MKIKDYLNKDYEISLIALTYLLDKSKSNILLSSEQDLDLTIEKELEEIIKKVKQGYPLQYAIGYWQFYDLLLKVDKRALIPRFETEIIVDYIIKADFKKESILDIGTGSGAIALSLANNLKKSKVTGIDISLDALDLSRENKKYTKIENVKFLYSDIFSNINKKYDLIVSNPPYIGIDEYNNLDSKLYYEPENALLADDNGLYFYKKIIRQANNYIHDGGLLVFEIGYNQKDSVTELLIESNFKNIKSIKDFNNFDRFIIAQKG